MTAAARGTEIHWRTAITEAHTETADNDAGNSAARNATWKSRPQKKLREVRTCPQSKPTPKRKPTTGPRVGLQSRAANASENRKDLSLSEAPAHPLKAATRLLKHPLHYSRVVVTESQIVIQRRETMRLARLLHFIQL